MQKRGQSDDAKPTVARHQHPPAADTETCSRSDAKPDGAGVAAGIAWRKALADLVQGQLAVPRAVAIGAGHGELLGWLDSDPRRTTICISRQHAKYSMYIQFNNN